MASENVEINFERRDEKKKRKAQARVSVKSEREENTVRAQVETRMVKWKAHTHTHLNTLCLLSLLHEINVESAMATASLFLPSTK